MTIITGNYNSSYSLAGQQKASDAEDVLLGGSTATKKTEATTTIQGAYTLDLSPEAQRYLKAQSSAKQYSFSMTSEEKAKVATILEKYKDEPFTLESFKAMTDELESEKLDIEHLTAKDMVRNFNPLDLLVQTMATGGSGDLLKSDDRLQSQSKKAETYYNQLFSEWRELKKDSADYDSLPRSLSDLIAQTDAAASAE